MSKDTNIPAASMYAGIDGTDAFPAAAPQDERAQFEAWAERAGLIARSHGIVSVNSQCDTAWSAWQARAALPAQAVAHAPQDQFQGDDSKLVPSINALLALDAAGSLVPHGIGGLARTLLEAAASRLATAADEPVGFVSAETLADLADPTWLEQRGVSADLWGANNPPSRAQIPLYTRPAPVQDVEPTDDPLRVIAREVFSGALRAAGAKEDEAILALGAAPQAGVLGEAEK